MAWPEGSPTSPTATAGWRAGGLAGFCTVREEDAAEGREVVSLYVDPGVQRRGVGTALLYRALDRPRDEGWTEVSLSRSLIGPNDPRTGAGGAAADSNDPRTAAAGAAKDPNDPGSGRMASSQAAHEPSQE